MTTAAAAAGRLAAGGWRLAEARSHGWFAGIAGDIAFAALVVGGDSSAPAIAVSGNFLRQDG